jgi:hypothetical protein
VFNLFYALQVPDRGGRAYEHDIPPPEMPAFKKRQAPMQQRPGGLFFLSICLVSSSSAFLFSVCEIKIRTII